MTRMAIFCTDIDDWCTYIYMPSQQHKMLTVISILFLFSCSTMSINVIYASSILFSCIVNCCSTRVSMLSVAMLRICVKWHVCLLLLIVYCKLQGDTITCSPMWTKYKKFNPVSLSQKCFVVLSFIVWFYKMFSQSMCVIHHYGSLI
jgi:hypothetical protein